MPKKEKQLNWSEWTAEITVESQEQQAEYFQNL